MKNTIEYPVTVHAPASVLSLGSQIFLYHLVNIVTVGFSMGPYMEGNDHVDWNSFYSMECSPNYTKVSEHLNIVKRQVHSQYQDILWCSAFARAVSFTKITSRVQKHELKIG